MKRTFPALTALATLVGVATGVSAGTEDATPENAGTVINLADLNLDFSKIPAAPQTYAVRMQGRSTNLGRPFKFDSTLTLRTTYDGSNVVFNDRLDFAARTFSFNLICEAEATLTPVRGSIRMDHPARSLSAELLHNDASETLNVTTEAGQSSTIDFPDDTVTEAALFRIVTCLPRTPGRTYAFPAYCPINEIRPATPEDGKRCTLTCRGEQTIDIDHRAVTCTQYVANFEGDLTFFVDANSVVRKVLADFAQTEMTLVPTPGDTAVAGVEDQE